jgi:signal transduction histidine kinase
MGTWSVDDAPWFFVSAIVSSAQILYVPWTGLADRTPLWARITATLFPVGATVVYVWYFRRYATHQDGDLLLAYGGRASVLSGFLYATPGVGVALQQRGVGLPILNADVLVIQLWLGGALIGLTVGHFYARTKAEQSRLERRKDQLQRRRQRLTVLNRVLRHDIRTEINVISGAAAQLAQAVDDASAIETIESRSDKIVEISDNARRIETLIDRGGKTTKTVDVTDIVAENVADLEDRWPSVEVHTDVPEATDVVSNGLVDAAITNVLANAVEHNDADDPLVDVSVESDGGERLIRIADNGPGIPAQERDVFAEHDETDLQHSSGLGLWLVHWIVEDVDGTVEIEDRQPRGTVVTLRFPPPDAARPTAG